jgi:ABC-2 type transport system permease protein
MVRKALSIAGLVLLGLGIGYELLIILVTWANARPDWVPGSIQYLAVPSLCVGLIVTYILWFRRCYCITVKELRTYFTSPIAYAVMMAIFGISGLLFWWTLKGYMKGGETQETGTSFMTIAFLLLFISPLLTMRLFAEEKRSGTYETLMTRPVHDLQVVMGKFVAAVCVMLVMLVVVFIQPLIVELGGDPDWGPVWTSYVGLIGWAFAIVAIGVFTSALTSSQIASAALSWFFLVILWLLGALRWVEPQKAIAKVGEYMSISGVMEEFTKGTLDTTRFVYLLSVTVFFLFAAWMTLFANRSK